MRIPLAVRSIAVLELAKGGLVLLAGFGLLSLVHRSVYDVAVRLIAHAHLNPAAHYPSIFLDAAGRTGDTRLVLYAAGAAVYAGLRLLEGYGLWFGRAWAEWLAALSGGLYIPVEVYELFERPTPFGALLLLVNAVVVGVMARTVVRRRHAAAGAPER